MMTNAKQVTAFTPLAELPGVFVAHKGNLRCSAVRLRDGSLCLYSPVLGLGETAVQSLAALGPVKYLLAPNHYHHMGLREYAIVFPSAVLCATPFASPRLAKTTGLTFNDLTVLANQLPKHMQFIEPAGLKTGEVWLRCRAQSLTAWLVVDAIAGPKMLANTTQFDAPEYLKTFPTYGVRHGGEYSQWFAKQLAQDQPQLVVPCHGGVVAAKSLPSQLAQMQNSLFGKLALI